MKTTQVVTRRRFLETALLGSAVVASAHRASSLAQADDKGRDPFRGLKVGIASYSLRKYPLDQAIAMTREAGVRYITLKSFHLPLESTTAQCQEARRKIEAAGLVLMGGGVIVMKNHEDEIRRAFEYARDAGMPTIVCSPDPAALDTVEKFARQFNIRAAIHNHGPGDKRFPLPQDAFKLVKDRHALMGVCMDVGHTVRVGGDALAAIKECASRLYDFHIKDVSAATPKGVEVVVGKGVIDIPAVLKALLEIKFSGHLALEFEAGANDPLPGIKESFAYLRQVLAAMS